MNYKSYYKFLLQLISILISKGAIYILTIVVYNNDKEYTSSFFVMNSVSSFLGPLIIFGNGSIITKFTAIGKLKYVSIIKKHLLSFLFYSGLFFFTINHFFSNWFFLAILLSMCNGIYSYYNAEARAYDGFQTIKVSLIKGIALILSIYIMGFKNFPVLIFIIYAILMFLDDVHNIRTYSLKTYFRIFTSHNSLNYHAFSRWMINSYDKSILTFLNNPIMNDYTLVYTLSSGISLISNGFANFLPRLIFKDKFQKNIKKFTLLLLTVGVVINIIFGISYLHYFKHGVELYVSLIIICLCLFINSFTVIPISYFIAKNKFLFIKKTALIISLFSVIVFSIGTLSENVILFSSLNFFVFGVYLVIIFNEFRKK